MAFSPDESSTGMAPTTAAGLAALFGVFGAIFFTFAERKSHFVWLYIHQSYRIFIIAFLGEVTFGIGAMMGPDIAGTSVKSIGGLLLFAYVLCLLALTVNAFQGKVFTLPVFGAGLKRKLKLEA